MAAMDDGRKFVAATANVARIWDAGRLQLDAAQKLEHKDRVLAIAYSPDGRLIATGSADRTGAITAKTDIRKKISSMWG